MLINNGFNYQQRVAGTVFRVRYYTETIGSVWDDERTNTQSGNDLYISGTIQQIDAAKGSDDQVLMEQGRIRYDDSKIFLNGSVQTTSGQRVFTIALSGATTTERVFREIMPGAIVPSYYGVPSYKKLYVRELPMGSLF